LKGEYLKTEAFLEGRLENRHFLKGGLKTEAFLEGRLENRHFLKGGLKTE